MNSNILSAAILPVNPLTGTAVAITQPVNNPLSCDNELYPLNCGCDITMTYSISYHKEFKLSLLKLKKHTENIISSETEPNGLHLGACEGDKANSIPSCSEIHTLKSGALGAQPYFHVLR